MIGNIITDFVSRECKHNMHGECYGTWLGLGYEVICSCRCGHIKKYKALDKVGRPVLNASSESQPLLREATYDNA
jgi:hypothetical protein